ncbi:MAG: hypothetical protein DRO11_07435 [Methanobacteriota archaeon]|nr:MAG: hypothetical protein DRO11_07435 [Euryarchaeota archaeon]
MELENNNSKSVQNRLERLRKEVKRSIDAYGWSVLLHLARDRYAWCSEEELINELKRRHPHLTESKIDYVLLTLNSTSLGARVAEKISRVLSKPVHAEKLVEKRVMGDDEFYRITKLGFFCVENRLWEDEKQG